MIGQLSIISTLLLVAVRAELQPVPGTHCSPNQVVTKLTVYEDGAIEAECHKLPCGTSGLRCEDGQTSCKADSDIFSGMKWAVNGQSVLLRCCSVHVPKKIYVGTDLVSLGSYYTGGLVDEKDSYDKNGPEYDYISNIRTEQGGVRVWVYRVMCHKESASPNSDEQPHSSVTDGRDFAFEKRRQYLMKQMGEQELSSDSDPEIAAQEDETTVKEAPTTTTTSKPFNPLQYRPRNPLQYKPSSTHRRPQQHSALFSEDNPTGRLL